MCSVVATDADVSAAAVVEGAEQMEGWSSFSVNVCVVNIDLPLISRNTEK